MKKNLIVLAFFCLVLLPGCRNKATPAELYAYVDQPENGLVASQSHGPINYNMYFSPVELVALRNFDKTNFTLDSLKAAIPSHQKFQYYQLQIQSNLDSDFLRVGLTNSSDYYGRIAYYTSMAQTDFYLVSGHDSIPCHSYHFERSYGVRPFNTILLGFEHHETGDYTSDQTVVFYDRALDSGLLKFKFSKEALNNIPKISF